MQADFKEKVEAEFKGMIGTVTKQSGIEVV